MLSLLPFFPLQLVVFPGEQLNLHIFEPRYRQLILDAEQDGITFGVPTVINGEVKPIGTEVKLIEVSKRYPEGASDIKTLGQRVFRIKSFQPQLKPKLYAGGEIEFLDLDTHESLVVNQEIVDLLKNIYQTLKVDKPIKDPLAGFSTYDLAHYVGMDIRQEYEFLTLLSAHARQRYLLEHLRQIRPDVTAHADIQAKVKLNGHFKHLAPPL